jgi:hypothetical protein
MIAHEMMLMMVYEQQLRTAGSPTAVKTVARLLDTRKGTSYPTTIEKDPVSSGVFFLQERSFNGSSIEEHQPTRSPA